ncbi:hypothetical protein [Microbacterium sp. LWH3-1.2]|uniref:hypothetical protein n=1 Tax=Microbacterium sp. LWH3-1.2 TaxID=3135256 RepID=UPI00342515C0
MTVLTTIIVWSALSRPLDRHGITSALFLTAAESLAASTAGVFDVSLETAVVQRVAEIALVLLVFSDATRLDLRSLRHELRWP